MCIDYRKDLDITIASIKKLLHAEKQADHDWDEFYARMPQTNSAAEYVQLHPEEFFVPFEDEFRTLHLRLQVQQNQTN
jgi:hypothetical protein